MIHNLPELEPRFREIGQVKIGSLDYSQEFTSRGGGKYFKPIKFDHFEVILGKGPDGRPIRDEVVQKALEKSPRRLGILFPFDTLEGNYYDWMAAYSKTQKLCFGDGVHAQRLNQETQKYVDRECNCEWYRDPRDGMPVCKPHAILTFMIEAAGRIGGVYAYRTTSKNAIRALRGSLMQIMGLGIPLSMVPFDLVLTEKKVRTKDNRMETAWVVHVEFVGNTNRLFDVARERMQLMQTFGPSMIKAREIVQQQARRAMENGLLQIKGVADEFQPENVESGQAIEAPKKAVKTMLVEPMAPPPPPAPEAQVQSVPSPGVSAPEPPVAVSAPTNGPLTPTAKPAPTGPSVEEALAKANSLFD